MDVGLYKKIKDWLGQPSDTGSSTGTAHAKLTQLLTQLGLKTDAASSTGSVHAKLADIKTAINRAPWKNGNQLALSYGYLGSNIAGDDLYHDAFVLNGPRIILGGYFQILNLAGGLNSGYQHYTATIDNLILFNDVSVTTHGDPFLWETYNESYKSTWAWLLPDPYSWYTEVSDGETIEESFKTADTIIQLPPLLYVENSFKVSYRISLNYSRSPNIRWGLWHIPAS